MELTSIAKKREIAQELKSCLPYLTNSFINHLSIYKMNPPIFGQGHTLVILTDSRGEHYFFKKVMPSR